MDITGVEITGQDQSLAYDPYRALAAAIVLRAVQDAFSGNKFHPNAGMCIDRGSCAECPREAFDWLMSEDGQQMAEWAGIDADAMVERVRQFWAQGLYVRRRSKALVWEPRQEEEGSSCQSNRPVQKPKGASCRTGRVKRLRTSWPSRGERTR